MLALLKTKMESNAMFWADVALPYHDNGYLIVGLESSDHVTTKAAYKQ